MQLVQVALRSTDLVRSAAWWTTVLQTEPRATFDPPGLLFYDLAGVRLLLDHGGPVATVYGRVADLRAELGRGGGGGVPAVAEPQVIFHHTDDTLGPAGHDELMAFVADPDGNVLRLVEWVAAD